MLNRRHFLKTVSIASTFALVFLNSCKKILSPKIYGLTGIQEHILNSIHDHLFPPGKKSPGSKEIKSVKYIAKLLRDPHISDYNKRFILYGINWANDTAVDMYGRPFTDLSYEEKEKTLLDLSKYSNGEKWISKNITYIMEALLADPIYEVNKNETGWKWLKHKTGFPRPDNFTKYKYL